MHKLYLTGLAGIAAFALAASAAASPVLQIVMKDPGCHWFKVGSKFTTKYVAHGSIAIQNVDEKTLKFVSAKGAVLVKVGKTMRFTKGTYRITMIGQAKDDNVLRLVVK